MYGVFGLTVSSDVPIPGLNQIHALAHADVQITFYGHQQVFERVHSANLHPWRVSSAKEPDGEPVMTVYLTACGGWYLFAYRDGTEFVINRDGSSIWARWPNTLTLDDTTMYLLGPVFGFVSRVRGYTALHASSILINGRAALLVGACGAGKSTTAAALALRGYPFLGDDVSVLAIQGKTPVVLPAYHSIRLWPESVEALFDRSDALPVIAPSTEKRKLDAFSHGLSYSEAVAAIGAIFLLGNRLTSDVGPNIDHVSERESLVALSANTYANNLLSSEMRAHEFEVLGRLVKRVPVRRVTPHSDIAHLPQLCDVILDEFHRMTPAAARAA